MAVIVKNSNIINKSGGLLKRFKWMLFSYDFKYLFIVILIFILIILFYTFKNTNKRGVNITFK